MTTENVVNTPPPPPPPPMYAPPPYAPGAAPVLNVKAGQSIAALVLGCCSIFFYFTLIVPVLAIIFANIAMRAQRKAGQRVNGMAVAGLVLGIIFSFFGVMFMLYMASG
jgi:hypothetical protein